jgi:DNA-binding transcriptional LysR family regulator
MVSGCALPLLAQLLAEFHDRYPGVGIVLTEGGSDVLVESLRGGKLDVALIGSAGRARTGVEVTVIADEVLVATVGRDDPLAKRTTITISGLRDQPLICLPPGTGVRAALDAACAKAGFEPRVILEASALPMVAQLAGMGLGVAIVPTSTALSYRPALHVLAIGRPRIRSRLELAWSSDRATNPAAEVLRQHARTFMGRLATSREPAA